MQPLELLLGEGLALGDELLLAEGLDVAFVLEAQLLLDAGLDWQPVHIVARPVGDVVAEHPVIPDVCVFEDLVPGCAHVGGPGGVRRPVQEVEGLAVAPVFDGSLVGVDGRPAVEHRRLKFVGLVPFAYLEGPSSVLSAHTYSTLPGN